jgi:hypothetical protein
MRPPTKRRIKLHRPVGDVLLTMRERAGTLRRDPHLLLMVAR